MQNFIQKSKPGDPLVSLEDDLCDGRMDQTEASSLDEVSEVMQLLCVERPCV